jgi:hypothetical protein
VTAARNDHIERWPALPERFAQSTMFPREPRENKVSGLDMSAVRRKRA